ncbi:ArsR/SmtB family transcription factor [Oceanispirochaeta crateris]|uniref:ArsR/SmtB family transcription factor n=1 Tax=Oceanispirochaeta crateris TaxID=2518645 RepID=UPI001AF01B3B|nr:metalloregulator ArsR/SmtB family transcription factor [Oceanispirochaeta crateris]
MEKIFKALSNPLRVQILYWLKDPKIHFPPMEHLPDDQKGKGYVCVSVIQEKSGITQSTISQYLQIMKEADLLRSHRIGQWTYYQRNEKIILEFAEYIKKDL